MKMYKRPWMAYMIGAVLVWAGLFAATVLLLGGTPHFGEMLPILFVGAVYFIVIVPQGFMRAIAQSGPPHTP